MKFRTIFLVIVLVLMSVFLVINWSQLSADVPVNLLYTSMDLPLGMMVVAGFAAIILLCLVYMIFQQAAMTLEMRAQIKEARHAREVAEDAEKSRLTAFQAAVIERLDKLEATLNVRTDEGLMKIHGAMDNVVALSTTTQDELHKVGEQRFTDVMRKLDAIQQDMQNLSAEHFAEATRESEDKLQKDMFKDMI